MENRIKEILAQRGMTSLELANEIGISRVSLSNIINNKQEASANTLKTISDSLGVEFWELFMSKDDIIKGVVEETRPDVVVVVDALAARSTRRLNRTIQITNTGIHPGSGVGNHRNALTEESLGRPVVAIGVPTVVDAATIVNDALEKIVDNKEDLNDWKEMERFRRAFAELNNMYMTGKDVDAMIKRVSYTLSEGINIALA